MRVRIARLLPDGTEVELFCHCDCPRRARRSLRFGLQPAPDKVEKDTDHWWSAQDGWKRYSPDYLFTLSPGVPARVLLHPDVHEHDADELVHHQLKWWVRAGEGPWGPSPLANQRWG